MTWSVVFKKHWSIMRNSLNPLHMVLCLPFNHKICYPQYLIDQTVTTFSNQFTIRRNSGTGIVRLPVLNQLSNDCTWLVHTNIYNALKWNGSVTVTTAGPDEWLNDKLKVREVLTIFTMIIIIIFFSKNHNLNLVLNWLLWTWGGN